MNEAIPRLQDHLPDLLEFSRAMAAQIEAGQLRDGADLALRMRDFYTDDRLDVIDKVVPGWRAMAAYADGATLHHVTQALIALQLLPEYRQASPHLQALLEWSEMYHDLGKQVIDGQRDYLHAFRGATMAAATLPRLGFRTRDDYPAELESWTRLVLSAAIPTPDGKGSLPDNRALPQILQGVERMFGVATDTALIVEAVMLHQSLNIVPEWPNPASLADSDVPLCIRPALVPLLEGVMLVDSDAWQLFDPASKVRFRAQTLAVFATVRRLVGGEAGTVGH